MSPSRADFTTSSMSGSGHGNSQLRHEKAPACVFAIGTANPANCIKQDEYTDWYFGITKCDHLIDMKAIMKKLCGMMGIQKRYLQISEDLFREHPEFLDPAAPTLQARLAVVAAAMSVLATSAAEKAIAEWGRPAGAITHLVFSTSTSAQLPAMDIRIASLLGLSSDVQRTTISFQGCTGTSGALRVAKDIAENNCAARVLVVCADMLSIIGFHVPDDKAHPDGIIGHALFGDGAGAIVVGAGPQGLVERPIFEMLSSHLVTVPGTENVIVAEFTAGGLDYKIRSRELTALIDNNIEQCLVRALAPLGIAKLGWNNLFWVVHPGGSNILDRLAAALGLDPGKLSASRRVLSEYGNMEGPTLIFVIEEAIRLMRQEEDSEEDCGLLVAFGPGFTIDVMALRACTSKSKWKANTA